ncbi:MAG: aspartyl protease family protein [Chthoniobacterales bacterium]
MRTGTLLLSITVALSLLIDSFAAPPPSLDLPGYSGVQMRRGPQNHLLVAVQVNGRPATFLVDTGSDLSFFRIDRAATFALIASGDQTFRRGRAFPRAQASSLAIGGVELGATAMALADASQFRGTAPAAQGSVDGVIGLDLLGKHKAVINCHTRQLFLRRDPNRTLNVAAIAGSLGFVRIPLDETRQGGLTVPINLRGRPARLSVDTGAFVTGFDDDALRAFSLKTKPSHLTTRGFDGQIRPVQLAQIDNLKIGGVAIAPQTFAVMDLYGKKKSLRTHTGIGRIEYYAPRAPADRIVGVLGNELLDQRQAIIDLDSKSLFLK